MLWKRIKQMTMNEYSLAELSNAAPAPFCGTAYATASPTSWLGPASCSPLVERSLTISQGPLLDGWRIMRPLQLALGRDDQYLFVISDDVFLIYGDGSSPFEAYSDYVESLVEYYELVEQGAMQSPYDAAELRRLATYLQRV